MLKWRLLVILSVALFILIRVFIRIKKYNKIVYLHQFKEDDISKEDFKSNSLTGHNTVFFTQKNNVAYIKKYVISKSPACTLLICNYARKFKSISYYVLVYNRNKKLIDVLKVHEKDTSTTSKIVGINPKCRYINIVLGSCDDVTINSQLIRAMSKRTIRFSSFLTASCVFLVLFILRHLMLEIIHPIHMRAFYGTIYNVLGVGLFILVAFFSYLLRVRTLKRRNTKLRSGGIYEYEFF